MTTNVDMTIYNKKINPRTGTAEYHRTVINDVHWHTNQKTIVTESGLKSADEYKIRIPAASIKGYLPSVAYKKTEDITGLWTVENGDLFVRGVCDIDITKPSEIPGHAEVLSYSDNRRGALPHIRIGGGA